MKSCLIDIVMSSKNVNSKLCQEALELVKSQKSFFPKTDLKWFGIMSDLKKKSDNFDLKLLFSYHVNQYLEDCKKENPIAYPSVIGYWDYEEEALERSSDDSFATLEKLWDKFDFNIESPEEELLDELSSYGEGCVDSEFDDWRYKQSKGADVLHLDRRRIDEFAAVAAAYD